MSTPVHALIVDDDVGESSSLAELLSGADLTVEATQPLANVEETAGAILDALPDGKPRVLLLDYRLEDNTLEGNSVQFRGGTVATYVRDKDPELPIVLLTSEQKLHEWVERHPGMKNVFDWTLVKANIAADEGAAHGRAKITDFARAWEEARGWPEDSTETWLHMAKLMRAPTDGIPLFRDVEAEPPRGDVTGDVIHWLLHRALAIPGPLLDEDATRVTLGLSREGFGTDQIKSWLEDARYKGALAAFGTRWWAHLVRAKLAETCGGARPLDASARATCLTQALGTTFTHEGCNWCGGERTLEACFVCGDATDAAHCVRPLVAPLPAWADPWVVCFRCIATGKAEAQDLHFPPQVDDVVKGLREDRIRPPGA